MKRRTFITITATGIAAVAVPLLYRSCQGMGYDSALAEPRALSLIWDEETIEAVGKSYRKLVPEERKARALARLLSEGIPAEDVDMGKALEDKIKSDFETGRTVAIDGWILSVTEARQCALFSRRW
jgi:hypothetical protein